MKTIPIDLPPAFKALVDTRLGERPKADQPSLNDETAYADDLRRVDKLVDGNIHRVELVSGNENYWGSAFVIDFDTTNILGEATPLSSFGDEIAIPTTTDEDVKLGVTWTEDAKPKQGVVSEEAELLRVSEL